MIIGLSGYARVGKDTAAEALVKRGFVRVAFADALKRDMRATVSKALHVLGCGGDAHVMQMQDYEKNKETYRPLLVEYGRAMRNLQPGYWILRAALEAEKYSLVVVTDVRYADEADWIRRSGGIVIGISRPGYGPANDEERDSFSKFKPDFEVVNSGAVEDLWHSVVHVTYAWIQRNKETKHGE